MIPADARVLHKLTINGVDLTFYTWHGCKVAVSREAGRWHMSISRPDRYPHWHEIRDARYAFLPDNCTMAMILPPKAEYVNIHQNCFHLHEVEGDLQMSFK